MNTHQIPMPENKAMQYFLWVSYFHDSNITAIDFTQRGKRVELIIESIRDIDNDKTFQNNRRKRDQYLEAHRDRYAYKLSFYGCEYIRGEQYGIGSTYLYGVFLDSELLRRIQSESEDGKKYYHYRIILADGYMDLIFNRFTIKRVTGKVKYPDIEPVVDHPRWRLEWLLRESTKDKTATLDTAWVTAQLESDNDEAISNALLYLARNENRCVVEEARKIMKKPWPAYNEAREAAIWVLGQQGDESDLPTLLDEYFKLEARYERESISSISALTPKRFIMDAIEHIKARFPEEIETEPEQPGPHKTIYGVTYRL